MRYLALILLLAGCTSMPTVSGSPTSTNKGNAPVCISSVKTNPSDKDLTSYGGCQEDKPFVITVMRVSF